MSLFSQRKGLRPFQKPIQRESLDRELRNGLWSAVDTQVFSGWDKDSRYSPRAGEIGNLLFAFWLRFFKGATDEQPPTRGAIAQIRSAFFGGEWHTALDILDFIAQNADWCATEFTKVCNMFFKNENSAYRFVGTEITEITSATEIEAIEKALHSGVTTVEAHIENAVKLLSDRKSPDYRNAIKEAISAVEGLCREISGDSKATLGTALKKVGGRIPLHPAFERGVLALYGFTSDHSGIRHALSDEPNLNYSDAKFMVVLASSLCGFLLAKCAENGVEL